ncbi:MAG: DUF4445 domain-containing protein [Deltaproteobacteria bacterium]|nr:DUF4445 domain-containing protein [Deltaproteobacteria bacterium]
MKLVVRPFGKVLDVPGGTDLRSALVAAGLQLRSDCGGIGLCGKCQVRGRGGLSPPTPAESENLSPGELRKGIRLACQAEIRDSGEVFIPPDSMESRVRILVEGIPEAIRPNPAVKKLNLAISSQNSRRDLSWEALRAGVVSRDPKPPFPTLTLLRQLAENGGLAQAPLSLISIGEKLVAVEKEPDAAPVLGLAVDLGTTTIVGYLLDLVSGKTLAYAARKNPQAQFGADVVSRILYATQEPQGLKRLQDSVLNALNGIIREAGQKARVPGKRIFEICVVGNTTMHHLLLGLRPLSLTHFPYTPVIREALELPAPELGLAIHPEGRLYLPPLIAGFMGSDTIGVVLATRMHRRQAINLAIDFGTNGEVVLGNRERLVAASCAAGPAFEGSQIRYGMTGASGAIDAVALDAQGQVQLHTIDDYPPLGICGSGLVDAVAEIRKAGAMDRNGRLLSRKEMASGTLARHITKLGGQSAFLLYGGQNRGRKIYLTQKDVRELQLAKSALRAGINILMAEMGIQDKNIAQVFLAGAFGNYVKPESAMGIGLIPAFHRPRIKPVGNAAGMGAQMALLSVKARREAEAIAQKVEYLELAKHPDFQKEFIDGMAFP